MVPPMTNPPFFTRDRDAFIPTPVASGPWDPNSLHGRVITGLLAFAIEQRHGADDFVPARLTVDMFRLPTLAPIEVTTKLIRDGQRIKVLEAFGAGALVIGTELSVRGTGAVEESANRGEAVGLEIALRTKSTLVEIRIVRRLILLDVTDPDVQQPAERACRNHV